MAEYYVFENDEQKLVKCRGKIPSGRYAYIKGKFTRIGEAKNGPTHYNRSDDLGTKGVWNPVDGKMYDSRGAYYKSVKAHGCEIVGDDMGYRKKRQTQGDFNVRKELAQSTSEVLQKRGLK